MQMLKNGGDEIRRYYNIIVSSIFGKNQLLPPVLGISGGVAFGVSTGASPRLSSASIRSRARTTFDRK